MSKAKRERIILGLLLVVLLFAGWNLLGNLRSTRTLPVAESAEVVSQSVDTEPFSSLEITSDWAEGIIEEGESDDRNPFQYGAAPSAPRTVVAAPPQAQTFVQPAAPVRPPPPPLPLQYVGFSRVGGPAADLKAVLMGDDGLPYPALPGETLMGRYRIQEVTEEYVVIEDAQSGRRERLLVNLQD